MMSLYILFCTIQVRIASLGGVSQIIVAMDAHHSNNCVQVSLSLTQSHTHTHTHTRARTDTRTHTHTRTLTHIHTQRQAIWALHSLAYDSNIKRTIADQVQILKRTPYSGFIQHKYIFQGEVSELIPGNASNGERFCFCIANICRFFFFASQTFR